MARDGANDRGSRTSLKKADLIDPDSESPEDDIRADAEEEEDGEDPSFLSDPKRLAQTGALIVVIVAAIYLLAPKLVGVEDGLDELGDCDPVWIAIALAFGVAMFASYVALFRGVVGEEVKLRVSESYQITMAGLAATRLFSAGGAGGIVLTYWALRKAGMKRKDSAARMVAFLVLLYAVYMLTLLINGVLLRTGVFVGDISAPAGLTIVPAAIGGGVIAIFLLFALIPGDLERRMAGASDQNWRGRLVRRLATVPATAAIGTREALAFVREPRRGAVGLIGAVGFWASNIAILWASFEAFGANVPITIVVQGFFVGMFANLIPLPGGVGGVDAGMIGTFALFDLPGVGGSKVFAAVFTYRLIAFWLPLFPGILAFFQLRGTVKRWDEAKAARKAGRAGPMLPVEAARIEAGKTLDSDAPSSVTSQSEVESPTAGNG
ncbi:hypothetical protein BH10ACT11_BH10ACT11_06890 [soil metagenome]